MASKDMTAADLPLTGYYGNDWLWGESSIDVVKSYLLFFDKLVMTLPSHLVESALSREPVLAPALYETGLLINIEPEEWLDERTATHKIVAPLRRALKADADDDSATPRAMTTLSGLHFIRGENRATRALVGTLLDRGLMTPQSADSLVNIRSDVRQFILMQLAAAFIEKGGSMGLDLNLIDGPPSGSGRLWDYHRSRPQARYEDEWLHGARSRAILSDLSNISVNLSSVPLDEVIAFRKQHGPQYRAYLRQLRSFAMEYEESGDSARRRLFDDRTEELRDEAANLRKLSSAGFSKSLGVVAISGAGIAWGVRESDAVAAALSALAALMSLPLFTPPALTPFAYIFKIEDHFKPR